uniref:Retrotransposon Copia-like N-terminal domain-containing protein n=1 Tax=Ananas comosus var. bracteatus TaxID=296719 RepID=A0A6V7QG34_ANACO|nr:unnamed protein product [Ananas comosus var. bracteatus]
MSTSEGANGSTKPVDSTKPVNSDSPYYLHPSDNPGTVFVSCPLNGDNYPTWKRAMQNALNAKNKMGFVDGSITKPIDNSPDVHSWVKCNSMVISWIFNALSRDLHDSVAYADTAREIWVDLEERFSQGNAPRVHQLKRDLSLLNQGNLSVAAYYTKLKPLWDELQLYEMVPSCTCGAAKAYGATRETEKVHQFLMGLNDNFNTIRSKS